MSAATELEPTAVGKVEGLLAESARIKRKLAAIENKMNEDMDTIRKRAELAGASDTARVKEIETEIALIAKLNRRELFPGKAKSREFAFGLIGYRKGSGKIKQRSKVKVGDILAKLREYGLETAIKTKESLNLDAMKDWTDDRLESIGMRRQTQERFFVEVKTEKLSQL